MEREARFIKESLTLASRKTIAEAKILFNSFDFYDRAKTL